MEGLSLDTIMNTNQIDMLFGSEDDKGVTTEPQQNNTVEDDNNSNNNNNTTEVDFEDLFEDTPESVGSEEKSEESTADQQSNGVSQNTNFYSSIASALMTDGAIPDLNIDVTKIENADQFNEWFEAVVAQRLDDRQKRIDDAMNAGIEPSEVQKYENATQYLKSIDEEQLVAETEEAEQLRKELITYSLINRGMSTEKAVAKAQYYVDKGTDIDEAKDALESNIDFYENKYRELIKEGQQKQLEYKKAQKERVDAFEKSVMEDKNILGGIELDNETRKKVIRNAMTPIYTDSETGYKLTEIQKYQKEHPDDFLKAVSVLYTTTNGFKDLNKLVSTKVTKEVKKSVRELEHTLNNTARTNDGNIQFITGVSDPNVSFNNFDLDI